MRSNSTSLAFRLRLEDVIAFAFFLLYLLCQIVFRGLKAAI